MKVRKNYICVVYVYEKIYCDKWFYNYVFALYTGSLSMNVFVRYICNPGYYSVNE